MLNWQRYILGCKLVYEQIVSDNFRDAFRYFLVNVPLSREMQEQHITEWGEF